MFLAMNRFRVLPGSEAAFEEAWRARDGRLGEMPGFVEFHLLRGPSSDGHTLYASHTIWRDEAAFRAWTTSEQFRSVHRSAGERKVLYDGHPELETFTDVEGV